MGYTFTCTKCSLSKSNCCLTGIGSKTADLMVIGQSPTSDELINKIPFSGYCGRKVKAELDKSGIPQDNVYFTNVVKCLVPHGKTLTKTSVRKCSIEWLSKEVQQIKPKVIIALGSKACQFFDLKFISNTYFYNSDYNCYVITAHHPLKLCLSYSDTLHTEFSEAFKIAYRLLNNDETAINAESKDVVNAEYVEELSDEIMESLGDVLAVDLETTGLNFLCDTIVSVGMSDGTRTIGVPITDNNVQVLSKYLSIKKIVGHNFKFDMKFLRKVGINCNVYFDTMSAHFLIDKDSPQSLSELALKYLHTNLTKGTIDFENDDIDVKQMCIYGANDAWLTYNLYNIFKTTINSKFSKLYYNIIIPTLIWLANAEYRGVKVDRAYITSNMNTLQYTLKSILIDIEEDETIKRYCKEMEVEFKINSHKQLFDLLYTYLKCNSKNKKTNEKTLGYLSNRYAKYQFIKKIVEYRKAYKIYKTYLNNLIEYSQYDNRIHCNYNQSRVPTGRLSSSSPNLQNIPKEGDLAKLVRRSFVAEDGYTLMEADFKQAEFRSLAHYSNDSYMVSLINAGKDIHRIIAAVSYLKKEEDVTDHERSVAKTIVFGMMYGRGAKAISEELGIPVSEAENIKTNFCTMFKQSFKWMEDVKKFAKKYGYVKTLTGRIITLPDIYSKDKEVVSKALRCSVNYPIQGTAADMTNMAGAELYKALIDKKLDAHLIMQIHDSLIVECKKDIENEVKELMNEIMTKAVPNKLGFKVKLEIDIVNGDNLADHDD